MATPVYSTTFFAIAGLAGSRSYTVPAGFRAVVRDIDVYWVLGLSGAQFSCVGSAGQTFAHFEFEASLPAANQLQSWRGRHVVDEGDTFSVTTSGALDVSVAGYLLTLP